MPILLKSLGTSQNVVEIYRDDPNPDGEYIVYVARGDGISADTAE